MMFGVNSTALVVANDVEFTIAKSIGVTGKETEGWIAPLES